MHISGGRVKEILCVRVYRSLVCHQRQLMNKLENLIATALAFHRHVYNTSSINFPRNFLKMS